jgi:hypothetical protein
MIILKYLEHLRSANWIVEEREGLDVGLQYSVHPLGFFRCCKEPSLLSQSFEAI